MTLPDLSINGIPVLWREGPPPFTGALVVGVGAADETVRPELRHFSVSTLRG